MNSMDLFLLGKRLMQLGEEALMDASPTGELATRAHLLLLSDVNDHPLTTISEVVRRSGLPQSQVSGLVAKLVQLGALATHADPKDRRRTLILVNPDVSDRVAEVRGMPVDHVLRRAANTESQAVLDALESSIETLLRYLTDRRRG